jgi:predicted glycosyltransferase
MDDQEQLAEEWDRKAVIPALESVYDHIWVYGSEKIYDPLAGLDVSRSVRNKMTYTGYLRKSPNGSPQAGQGEYLPARFILVTTGGGGDGSELVDWVLSAYEHDPTIPHPAVVVFGPFMPTDLQNAYRARAQKLPNVQVRTFVPKFEGVMAKCAGVIAMGGYNTFCEILSADKPAIIVPRTVPRLEQRIRAERMSALGYVGMLSDDNGRDPAVMAAAIHTLPDRRPPSAIDIPGALDGFATINGIVDGWSHTRLRRRWQLIPTG